MENDVEAIKVAFESGANIQPFIVALLFYVFTIGLMIAFGIFVVLKKGAKSSDDESRADFFKSSQIITATIIIFLLFASIATI